MVEYIWSDLHLSHKNILAYCNRPFETIEQMNETLLNNWKETVSNDDVIFNLGDFCFNWNKQVIKQTLEKLPGYKVLILGNHDRRRSVAWWRDAGFDEVYPYPIIYKKWYILSHEDVFLNENIPYINIHGHRHQHSLNSNCYINVSVEHTNYKPLLLSSLLIKE